jgi:hypothetical protein
MLEACVNPKGLFLHQIQHRLDDLRGSEDLTVVGNTLLRLHKGHAASLRGTPDEGR